MMNQLTATQLVADRQADITRDAARVRRLVRTFSRHRRAATGHRDATPPPRP